VQFDRRLLFAAIAAWAVVAVFLIATGAPLGHDEAAFAVLARGGVGASWMYRSSGVIAIAKVGVALGGADWQLRIASAVVGLGLVPATYAVGRAAFRSRNGAWAAAVIAGAHPIVLRGPELIGDLPATACFLAGVAVLVRELDGERGESGPSWRLLAAAPAFAGAFYLRYGNAPVIAIAAAAAAALWWRSIARRPLPAIATAAAFVALLAPHAAQSLHLTGSVLGILEYSSHMPRRAYVGEGLVTYLTANPFRFYGALIAPLACAGLTALVRPLPQRRATWFLGAIAVGQIVAIGLQSHAQPRYVFIATTLLVVIGVAAVRRAFAPRPLAALALVVGSWLGCAIAVLPYNNFLARARRPLVAAASAIRTDAAGEPCTVIARVITQLAWYTECEPELLRDPTRLDAPPSGERAYVASVPSGTADVLTVAATLHLAAWPIATYDELSHVWRLR
jgi:hypothetical protein